MSGSNAAGIRPLLPALALAIGYCLAALVSIAIYRHGHGVAGFWIPNALAVALLLRHPPAPLWTAWPAIVGAGLLANVLTGSDPVATFLFAGANTVEVWLACTLLAVWPGRSGPRTETLSGYLRTVMIAGCVVPLAVGSVFAGLATALLGWPAINALASWWMGDMLGYAVVFPLALMTSRKSIAAGRRDGRLWQALAAAAGCAVFSAAALLTVRYPFVLMLVPLMAAAAWFPPACLAVTSAVVGGTVVALGIFGEIPGFSTHTATDSGLQLSLAVTVTLPFLGSLVIEQIRRDRLRIAESEQRFRRAMTDSAIGMALVGLDGRILQSNKAFAEMLGYPPAELETKTFFDVTYPEDRPIGRDTIRRVLAGEADSYRFEKRYVRKDGRPIWGRLAGSVIRDQETGAPMYLVSQIEDIDAQRKADEALKEAENRWSFALESAGQGVWDFDVRTKRTYYSPLWKKLLGYEPEELNDDPDLWLQLMHPDDREGVLAADKALKAGDAVLFEAEFRMRHKDGRWIWISDRGSILERDAAGTVLRAVGTHTDITRQKETEQHLTDAARALADEKERLRITLHSIADAVVCTDAGDRVTFMNPAAESLTGVGAVDAYGERLDTVLPLIDEETGELIRAEGGQARSAAQAGRAVLVRPDGSRRSIRERVSPILTTDDDFAGTVIVFQDVTDARALQRELAHAAAHDPLTGLANRSGFVRALLQAIDAASTDGSEHALLFVDLDRFKAVNDTAGHLAGDALLKKIAGILRKTVRADDVVARFGGDEFAVLLRACPLDTARSIAEVIVTAVRETGFVWEGRPHQIGASIGIAPITRATREMDEVVAEADEACYASKAAGRGRVTVAGRAARAVA